MTWDGTGVDPFLPQRLAHEVTVTAAERRLYHSWLGSMSSWLTRVRRSVLGGGRPDPAGVFAQAPEWVESMDRFVNGDVRDVMGLAYRELFGADYDFDGRPAVVSHLSSVTNRMVRTPDEVFDLVAAEVSRGATAGLSIPDVADRIDEILTTTGTERWPHRAVTVARTECLTGETLVESDGIRAVYRRWYEGPAVRVHMASGYQFTGTPNHPVLTAGGWLALGHLQPGDELVRHAGGQGLRTSADEHVGDVPAPLGQIYDALSAVGVVVRAKTRKPDFHGDGMDGYVDVATTDRELAHRVQAPELQHLGDLVFELTRVGDVALHCSRQLLSVGRLTRSAHDAERLQPPRDRGGVNSILLRQILDTSSLGVLRSKFVDVEAVHPSRTVLAEDVVLRTLSRAGVPDLHAVRLKNVPDHAVVSAELLADPLPAVARPVGGEYRLMVDVGPNQPLHGSALRGQPQPGVGDYGPDAAHVDAVGITNSSDGLTRPVGSDYVVRVDGVWFAGHVYNLFTERGWFGVGQFYSGNTIGALSASRQDSYAAIQEELGVPMEQMWLCVAPDTPVLAATAVLAARRRYKGPLVHLATASGRAVAVTPQHRVLTGRGWLPAQAVHKGDYLLQVVGVQPVGAPDVEDVPPKLGELVDAAVDAEPVKVWTVPVAVDLHDEATDGEIEVVPVDRDLTLHLNAGIPEGHEHLIFSPADLLGECALLAEGPQLDRRLTHGNTEPHSPHRVGSTPLHGGVVVGSSHLPGRALVSDGDSGLLQHLDHRGAGTAEGVPHRLNGDPALVHGDDGSLVQVVTAPSLDGETLCGPRLLDRLGPLETAPHRSRRVKEFTARGEMPPDRDRTDRQSRGDLGRALSGPVAADDVFLVQDDRGPVVGTRVAAAVDQDRDDSLPAHVEGPCDRDGALACVEPSQYLRHEVMLASTVLPGLRLVSERDACVDETLPDRAGGDVQVAGQLPDRCARLVALDEVVDVDVEAHEGHVYDLSTVTGWFLADGLIIHNSTLDARTRDDHQAADGQRVAVGEPFIVGGEALAYPADPAGSASNTINCRCATMIVSPGEEVDMTGRQFQDEWEDFDEESLFEEIPAKPDQPILPEQRGVDLEDQARARQARIDVARTGGKTAAEFDQMVTDLEGDLVDGRRAVEHRIGAGVARGTLPDEVASAMRAAVVSNDPDALLAAVWAHARTLGAEQVERAGSIVVFDRKVHAPAPGATMRAGDQVFVVRPGVRWLDEDGLLLEKAIVEEASEAEVRAGGRGGASIARLLDGSADAKDASLREVFEGEFAGLTTRVTKTGGRDGMMWVEGDILDAKGRKVGEFGRSISREDDGKIFAEHGHLELDRKQQGTGFASEFNGRAVDFYRRTGVDAVYLHANADVGGYAWARQGFDWAGGSAGRVQFDELRELVDDLRAGRTRDKYGEAIPKSIWNAPDLDEQLTAAEALLARAERTEWGDPQYPTAFELSQVGRNPAKRGGKRSTWLGKHVMLGSSWQGILWLVGA